MWTIERDAYRIWVPGFARDGLTGDVRPTWMRAAVIRDVTKSKCLHYRSISHCVYMHHQEALLAPMVWNTVRSNL
jgi:hypothetical protein